MNAFILIAAVYGSLVGGDFVHAPNVVNVDGYWRGTETITEPQANALGYKLLVDERPVCASNEYAVATGYDYDSATSGQRIRRTYRIEPIPVAPRKFSKLKIYCGLATMGEWDKIEAWLKTKDFNGVNGLKAFDLAQEVSEDHALFKPLATEARTILGWDEAKMNGFLDTCILGE